MASRIDPNSLAIDSNALNGLKRSAQNESPEAIRAAAKQFEAVLMNMMLKSMRDTVPQDGPMDNEQSKMFTSMLDQQLSSHLSQKGLGLAEVLAKQLTKQQLGQIAPLDPSKPARAEASPASLNAANASNALPTATPLPLTAAKQAVQAKAIEQIQTQSQGPAQPQTPAQAHNFSSIAPGSVGVAAFLTQPEQTTSPMASTVPAPTMAIEAPSQTHALPQHSSQAAKNEKLMQAYQALQSYQAQFAEAAPMPFAALTPAQFSQAFAQQASRLVGQVANRVSGQVASHTQQFIAQMLPHAEAASAMSGIPAKFMVGQAALESGWGKHSITTADGQPSHNLFGIKADARWTGKVASSVTTEYINGVKQTRVEKFRAYDSYAEAFFDYARLISQQPRYQQAMQNTHDAKAYAQALQRAGYATDPHYGQKLAAVITRMRA